MNTRPGPDRVFADLLRSLADLRLTDEDDKAHVLKLRPPATDAELRKLEAALPAAARTGLRVGALRPTHRDPAGRPGTPLGPHSAGAEEGSDAATVRQIFLTGD
jgi:hypothetical protein